MHSDLIISTKLTASGKTQLDRCFVSPPFKLLTLPATYTTSWHNELNAVQMSSSPGLLGGDRLNVRVSLAPKTSLSLSTQAFTRVQAMNHNGYAEQNTHIQLAPDSRLFYLPHPLVLHKESAFKQTTLIELSERNQLIYGEIIAVGRILNHEQFAFRHFSSYLRIVSQGKPLLSDRIQWQPQSMPLTALSQMEDFTHQGTLVYINLSFSEQQLKKLTNELQAEFSSTPQLMLGISQLNQNGILIRSVGYRAENIEKSFKYIADMLKVQT
ncbi:urease accessory protein [Nicoletella semolina]|uniref:Urease accessory protein UreD n=1 Tax=Nicoletella semolina TaxID=271160 RepID=A0A4R2NBT6_9PAST|nr:urease accessory protein UreD [Nicoletella semolina]MDH2924908.1 urease accessory protein UreD [Nicoletella semolina]TCP18452.1 urease accessory protein [Nicoletella semolina]